MSTLPIPSPVWTTPSGWLDDAIEIIDQLDDNALVDAHLRLVCAEIAAANAGVHIVAIVAARRWTEWTIGTRLGPGLTDHGKPINPTGALATLSKHTRNTCRQLARVDGDILRDHLATATTLDQLTRRACLRYSNAEVTA